MRIFLKVIVACLNASQSISLEQVGSEVENDRSRTKD